MPSTSTADLALDMAVAGHSFDYIAASLGYSDGRGARRAIERALRRRTDVDPTTVGFAARPAAWVRPAARRTTNLSGLTAAPAAPATGYTFGVEIEVNRLGYTAVRRAMQAAGLSVDMAGNSYSHATSRNWKGVTDASVQGGGEAVSPPLSRDEIVRQGTMAMEAFTADGGTVSAATGMHLHVGSDHFTGNQIAAILEGFQASQSHFDRFICTDRRANNGTYSGRSFDRYGSRFATLLAWFRSFGDNTIEHHASCDRTNHNCHRSCSRTQMPWSDRYMTMNPMAFIKHGTLEFRQHSGTLNGTKLANCVDLLAAFFTAASTGTDFSRITDAGDWLTVLVRDGGLATDAAQRIADRMNHFGGTFVSVAASAAVAA